MKSQPNNRGEKIRLLNDLQCGKISIQEIRPWKVEFWYQHNTYPDVFINEKTGGVINARQMQEKQKHKGDDVLFITILNYEHDPK